MNWLSALLENLNYGTILFLMLLESTVIPVPSELVVAPAAYHAAGGNLNILLVILAATVGACMGASVNYAAGYYLGRPIIYRFANSRWGKMCLLNQQKVEHSEKYFNEHGKLATVTGRLVIGVRHLISIPAGLAKMNYWVFLLYTAIGAGLWNCILAALGWYLHSFVPENELQDKIVEYGDYIKYGIVALVVLAIVYLTVRHIMKKRKSAAAALLMLLLAVPAVSNAQRGDFYGTMVPAHSDNVYYGVRLGVLSSTVNSDDKNLDGGKAQAGLNVGVVIGFQVSPEMPLFLEAGLTYSEKGGKRYDDSRTKVTYDLNYIEMPIVAKYKIDTGYDILIDPFVGGYLAYGFNGKAKNFADRQVSKSFSKENFQRFDGGLRIGCGAEYKVLYLEIGYDFGLANISHDNFDSSHNGAFFANIGVNF